MPTFHHALRATVDFDSLKSVVALWALECDKLLVYEHNEIGKKVHCHILIEGHSSTAKNVEGARKTLYNIFERKFPGLKGQEHRAGKKFDGDYTYISYMSKGTNEPKYNKGYDTAYLEEKRKAWVKPQDHVKVSKDLANYLKYMNEEHIEYAFKKWKEDHPKPEDVSGKVHKFKFLQSWVLQAVIEEHSVLNQQARNMYNMLIQTYTYQNSIPNPHFEKWINR